MKICFEAILSSLQFDFYPFLIVEQIRKIIFRKIKKEILIARFIRDPLLDMISFQFIYIQ